MRFRVRFTPSAERDLAHLRTYEQRIVHDGARAYLLHDANVETRKRKQLRQNELAPWELRLGNYRVFYQLEAPDEVKVIAVGVKAHNDLYIRGKKVVL